MAEHGHDHQHGHGHGEGHGHAGDGPQADRPRWDASFWDERYSSAESLWSGHVNAVVRDETSSLTPGRALDVGCGEGGDAFWLAEQGWSVVGVDLSQVAIERAAARAVELGVADRATFEVRDLMAWAPPEQAFDLVTVAFVHLPPGERRTVYAGLADAVAVGGSFVVGAHHPSDIGVVPRPPYPDLFFTADELAADLADGPGEWEVIVAEARPRPATHPEGHGVEINDTVLHARRTA